MDDKNIIKNLNSIFNQNISKSNLKEIDSLNKIKYLIKIEKKFKIDIQPNEIKNLFNSKNIFTTIKKKLLSKKSS
jgi:acyl carrier protein